MSNDFSRRAERQEFKNVSGFGFILLFLAVIIGGANQ